MNSLRVSIATVALATDRGWCDRLRCELTGAACSARHQATETMPVGLSARPAYPHCASCPTGKLVTLRLRQKAPEPTRVGRPLPYTRPAQPAPTSPAVPLSCPCALGRFGCTATAYKPRKTVAAVNVWGLDLCRQHRALVAARCVPGREHDGQHQALADYLRANGTISGFGKKAPHG